MMLGERYYARPRFLQPRSFNRVLAVAALLLMLTVPTLVWLYRTVHPPESKCGDPRTFGVVFDAGSTGTRVHVFTFEGTSLAAEVYASARPGLSGAFAAGGAAEVAASLRPLVRRAASAVPSALRHCTEVVLRATAGLRLLPAQSVRSILKAVRSELEAESPFAVPADAVQLMSGEEEAVDAWLALAFLTGTATAAGNRSIATVDMGGGSTQIVYPAAGGGGGGGGDGAVLRFEQREWSLRRRSLLGLGLKEAGRLITAAVTKGPHPCWVPGTGRSVHDYAACERVVRSVVAQTCAKRSGGCSAPSVSGLLDFKGDIFALSYVHDRARHWLPATGRVTVGWFLRLAKAVCAGRRTERGRRNSGTMCMDLCFIHSLLSDAFKLPQQREVIVRSRVAGFDASWALGTLLRRRDAAAVRRPSEG